MNGMEKIRTYEEIRDACIAKYKKLYKEQLVFDLCMVDKPTRVKLLEDPVFIMHTKASRARLFEEQLDVVNEVLSGVYAGEDTKDRSATVLKALEMKQKLLLDDIGINDDIKNALNIVYVAMSREDFEAMETVEVYQGSGNTELSSDFGMTHDDMSAEEKAKKLLADKQREAKMKKEVEDGNS